MAEPRDDRLIAELRELAGWVDVPPAPDVTAAVRERLAAPAPRRWWRRRRWRWFAAGLVAALAVGVTPPVRAAVSDLLRFAGVEVSRGRPGPLPASPKALPGAEPVALAEARKVAKFPIGVPAQLGPPEEVILADRDATGAPRVVSLRWRGGTVVLDEYDGRLDMYFAKTAEGVTWTTIDGNTALWFQTPHPVAYVDRAGVQHTEAARLAGQVLVWQGAGVCYRLEGIPALDAAVEIARSIP